MKTQKKKGFTLAEVLITIAILGIVAVLTIPPLIKDHQKKVWSESSSVFEKRMKVALGIMNTKDKLAGLNSTQEFVEELSKTMKITKTCDSEHLNKCFKDKFKWNGTEIELDLMKTAKNLGRERTTENGKTNWSDDTDIIGLHLNNGTIALVAYNTDCATDSYNNDEGVFNCIAMVYDTNGYSNPNETSKDIRAINTGNLAPLQRYTTTTISCWFGSASCLRPPIEVLDQDISPSAVPSLEEAQEACSSIGMRLPDYMDMTSIRKAYEDGILTGFVDDKYWSSNYYVYHGQDVVSLPYITRHSEGMCMTATNTYTNGIPCQGHVRCVK